MDHHTQQSGILQTLPAEIIIKIFTYLPVKDLKTCRLLSQQFYDFMLESSKIMKKLRLNFRFSNDPDEKAKATSSKPQYRQNSLKHLIDAPINLPELCNFVEVKGQFIKCINLKLNKFDKISWSFLDQLQNLEDLTVDEKKFAIYAFTSVEEHSIDLSKLKSLKINLRLLKSFASCTKNIHNLKKLSIFISIEEDQEFLTNFVAEQKNLKDLFLEFDPRLKTINFPSINITSKVKFQLKKFKFYMRDISNESQHFHKFVESQAGNLENLKLNFKPDEKFCEIILKKCRNLKKLALNSDQDPDLFAKFHPAWQLTSLTSIKDRVIEDQKFKSIIERFPNINKIKCRQLKELKGNFDKITKIETDYFYCHFMRNCSFPNLRSLHINRIAGYEIDSWKQFTENLKNLEHLTIYNMYYVGSSFTLDYLENSKKLTTLKLLRYEE